MSKDVRLLPDLDLRAERLPDRHTWWRIAEAEWVDPLDPAYAAKRGGRWNPPESFPTLYLNEDRVTARMNLSAFVAVWPYEPEDLRAATGPVLVGATLPRNQRVCDAHTPQGLRAAGLPRGFPLDRNGRRLEHRRCQPIGLRAKRMRLRGVRARSARTTDGTGRELAWFPATVRSAAREAVRMNFVDWYWG